MRDRGGQEFIREFDGRQSDISQTMQSRGMFRIHVFRNEDGDPSKPGDDFYWVAGEKDSYIDRWGHKQPMNTRERESMQRRWEQNPVKNSPHDPLVWSVHVLDDDCCITVDFHSAMALLTTKSRYSDHPEKQPKGCAGKYYWILEQVPMDWKQPTREQKNSAPVSRSTPNKR